MKILIVAGSLLLTGCFLQPVNQAERFDNHEMRISTLEEIHDIETVPAPPAGETQGSAAAGNILNVLGWITGIALPLLGGGIRKG